MGQAPAQVAAVPPVTRGGLAPAAPLAGKKTNSKRNLFVIGAIIACIAMLCVGGIAWYFVTPEKHAVTVLPDILDHGFALQFSLDFSSPLS